MGDDYTGFEKTGTDADLEKAPEVKPAKRFGRQTSQNVRVMQPTMLKFRNVSDGSVTVGFISRSVTWAPFIVQELTKDEVAEPAFQAKLKKFKEIR